MSKIAGIFSYYKTFVSKKRVLLHLSSTSFVMRREENQLDATKWLIALIICSKCFGHFYTHHQELETILVLLQLMMCNASVAGGQRSGAGQQAMHYTPYATITQV
jgi:hypothetical protein